jgi:hypothetical protein
MCYAFQCKSFLYKLVAAWMKIWFNFLMSFLLECWSMSWLSLPVGLCDSWWRWYLDTLWHSQGSDCTYSCRVSLDLEEIAVQLPSKCYVEFSLQSSRYKCRNHQIPQEFSEVLDDHSMKDSWLLFPGNDSGIMIFVPICYIDRYLSAISICNLMDWQQSMLASVPQSVLVDSRQDISVKRDQV